MVQPTSDTVVAVKNLTDAVNQLAASVRQKIKTEPAKLSDSITFDLSDLPNFKHLAGRQRSYQEVMALRKDIRLAMGLSFGTAFTFASIDSLTRDVHINGDLVTISVDIELKAKRS